MLVSLLICLALVAVASAMPFYASSNDGDVVRQFPQQGVLENMVNEIMRVQSVEQMNNHHVRRQIFSRKFW
ncbi:Neuropeptide-Like Protein [Caenorhabditis elegans]|uniref:Neuropeptide-Like Protein n=1 Tax=Caenorhabditis elegans TaxID=6239 RepID=Q5FC76_CAEEL|nr:Neuropeptide-Like Protein [Caenorhabditis elegans]CAI46610.1 Neuropeptide-Like Protein [Caenorhabditis elegans]|eukprot:NP_001022141.1 Neuropeptide-Like Protein [Caenorhabditis elegans]